MNKKNLFLSLAALLLISQTAVSDPLLVVGDRNSTDQWVKDKCGAIQGFALHTPLNCVGYKALLQDPKLQSQYTLFMELYESVPGINMIRYEINTSHKQDSQWLPPVSDQAAAMYIEQLILKDRARGNSKVEEGDNT